MRVSFRPALLVLLGMLFAPAAARAQACSVSVDLGLSFGSYRATDTAPRDTSANVTVACSHTVGLLVPYNLRVQSASGFKMSGPRGTLSYMVASDAAFSSPLTAGQSVGGNILLTALTLFGTRQHRLYGRLATGQLAGPGSYTDSVVVTLNF